jgi:hypothetical protein
MENALNSPSQVLGSQPQPPRRRNEIIKEIALALVTNNQAGGFDPYDNRLGSAQRDVWGKRRRA